MTNCNQCLIGCLGRIRFEFIVYLLLIEIMLSSFYIICLAPIILLCTIALQLFLHSNKYRELCVTFWWCQPIC